MEIKTNDWRAEIGSFFVIKKIYRLEHLNKQLQESINEWTDYLKKFDDIKPEFDLSYHDAEFNKSTSIFIKIDIRSKVSDYFPFFLYIGYMTDNDYSDTILKVRYSREISDYILGGNLKEDDRLEGIFHDEVIAGEEIFDKKYIFWKMNDLLKKWINFSEQKN
jgi:hypothetical protein